MTRSSSSRAGSRKSAVERRTTKIEAALGAQPLLADAETAQHLGARALGEFEVVGVIDEPRRVGVLVIDAHGIAVGAAVDGALARQRRRHAPSSSASARRSSCAARGAQRLQAEIGVGEVGQHAAARRALHEALLDEVRLDHVLDHVALLGQRRGDGLDADRAAGVVLGDAAAGSAGPWRRARAVDLEALQRVRRRRRGRCARRRRPRRSRAPGAAAAPPPAACRASAARSRRRRRGRAPSPARARRG